MEEMDKQLEEKVRIYQFDTVIVGSGAAAYNAADSLFDLGERSIAVVTEGIKMGTSRNTGSDKQTYYKLSLGGKQKDSVYELAKTLFQGGCMHGDHAMAEAALSARCFFKLIQLGVPFPCDIYGQYEGYKTDHDPMQRATSSGPLTSKYMTECLERSVKKKEIPIFDGYRVLRIFTEFREEERWAEGILALNVHSRDDEPELACFQCRNLIWAVGGPAGMYGGSVYPASQTGASGTAFEAGACGNNVSEWQYGIASVKFRWNLSGSYQQVIPCYLSTDQSGKDEREFLDEYFSTPSAMLDAIFLKGYQWPFDPRKISESGSSLVDLAVYNEIKIKKRRVFLDYRRNAKASLTEGEFDFSLLGEEAYQYLENSGALLGTPIDRLKKMNRPAYELYLEHGIDLAKECLEIDVCAQHNNGGLKVNMWWESNIKHLFPVGEAAGTLGVYRPGGTALNSTQAGSLRAAQYIVHEKYKCVKDTVCQKDAEGPGSSPVQGEKERFRGKCLMAAAEFREKYRRLKKPVKGKQSPAKWRKQYQSEMDICGGIIREQAKIEDQLSRIRGYMDNFLDETLVMNIQEFKQAMINWDILTSQLVYLSGMKDYIERGGCSRGSYLIRNKDGTNAYFEPGSPFADLVQETSYDKDTRTVKIEYVPARPLPEEEIWFEDIYREMTGIKRDPANEDEGKPVL